MSAYTATAIAGRGGHVRSSDDALRFDSAAAGPRQVTPREIRVMADITIDRNDSGPSLAARLTTGLACVDRATAERIVHAAHELCPCSRATRGTIDVELVVA